MSASATQPRQAPPPDIDLAALPASILMNFVVLTLAPMLLTAAGADIGFARIAVLETIKSYQPRNQPDLIAVAQIVACGLAALGSLGLSMTGDLPLPMILRLRGNATALIRTAEHSRRARRDTIHHPAETHFEPADAAYEAEVLTSLAELRKAVRRHPGRVPGRRTRPAASPDRRDPGSRPGRTPASSRVGRCDDQRGQAVHRQPPRSFPPGTQDRPDASRRAEPVRRRPAVRRHAAAAPAG